MQEKKIHPSLHLSLAFNFISSGKIGEKSFLLYIRARRGGNIKSIYFKLYFGTFVDFIFEKKGREKTKIAKAFIHKHTKERRKKGGKKKKQKEKLNAKES